MRPAGRADQPLAGELGLAVRADRQAGGVLGDQRYVREAVDGGGGGEQEAVDTGRRDGLQQGAQTAEVLAVVQQRLLDGLADLLTGREMDDAGHPVVRDRPVQRLAVECGTGHDGHPGGDPLRDAGRTVVVHDHALPGPGHSPDHVRSDESGPAGDQPRHAATLSAARSPPFVGTLRIPHDDQRRARDSEANGW